MTKALLYQSRARWRFGAALGAAAMIHLAAFSFAGNQGPAAAGPPSFVGEPTDITFEPSDPIPDPPNNETEPLPTPPVLDPLFVETPSTPLPVRKQIRQATPIVKARTSSLPGPMNVTTAKVFAVSAPRPEYPYEARRQKITGEGIVVMNVDPLSGDVTSASMSQTTGSAFLDNAAIAGFKRWRFRPGTVAAVTCPVTFKLTGASY